MKNEINNVMNKDQRKTGKRASGLDCPKAEKKKALCINLSSLTHTLTHNNNNNIGPRHTTPHSSFTLTKLLIQHVRSY